MDPLATMLESNYTLESLLLQGSNCFSVKSPRVSFLLSLNHSSVLGRRQLFQTVMQHDQDAKQAQADSANTSSRQNPWVEAVVKHKDADLNILYYLLGKNPNLIASAVVTCR